MQTVSIPDKQPISALRELIESLPQAYETDFETVQKKVLDFIDQANILDHNKKKMKMIVQYQIFTVKKLYMYLNSSMQIFEGNGTIAGARASALDRKHNR